MPQVRPPISDRGKSFRHLFGLPDQFQAVLKRLPHEGVVPVSLNRHDVPCYHPNPSGWYGRRDQRRTIPSALELPHSRPPSMRLRPVDPLIYPCSLPTGPSSPHRTPRRRTGGNGPYPGLPGPPHPLCPVAALRAYVSASRSYSGPNLGRPPLPRMPQDPGHSGKASQTDLLGGSTIPP